MFLLLLLVWGGFGGEKVGWVFFLVCCFRGQESLYVYVLVHLLGMCACLCGFGVFAPISKVGVVLWAEPACKRTTRSMPCSSLSRHEIAPWQAPSSSSHSTIPAA